MKERGLLISWGSPPRGREAKALEIFENVHNYLKKKSQDGKIQFSIYLNGQGAELAGIMLIQGKPEYLAQEGAELERLYMQAAAVVDNLSSKMLIGGTEVRCEGTSQPMGRRTETAGIFVRDISAHCGFFRSQARKGAFFLPFLSLYQSPASGFGYGPADL